MEQSSKSTRNNCQHQDRRADEVSGSKGRPSSTGLRTSQRIGCSLISNNGKHYSSFVLFLSVVILVNLCPFSQDFEPQDSSGIDKQPQQMAGNSKHATPMHLARSGYLDHLEECVKFLQLMFTSPIRLGTRTTRFTQAEAKVIGKMAKMWYIKKKIKKLSKKLKKHTIAVPVFTAIPIYEHSYYPHQQQVGHVSSGSLGHTTGGSYSHAGSAVLPVTASPNEVAAAAAAVSAAAAQSQQLATSASDTHQRMAAYHHNHNHHNRMPASHPHRQAAAAAAAAAMYQHHPAASAHHHQIINSYAPSPPLFVDEAGGLYGHYGNAYGRYDGGYQLW